MAKINKTKASKAEGRYAFFEKDGGPRVVTDTITLETVYSSLQDIIFTKDKRGRITSVNDIYAMRMGKKKKELIGIDTYTMEGMTPEISEGLKQIDTKVMQTKKTHTIREWYYFPDGSRVFVEILTNPLIDSEGNVHGVLVMIRDMTEMKLALDEVSRQNNILEIIGKVSELMLEPDINAFANSIYEAMEIIAEGIGAHRIEILRLRGRDDQSYYTLEYDWTHDRTIGNIFTGNTGEEKRETIFADKDKAVYIEDFLKRGRIINGIVSKMPRTAQDIFKSNGLEAACSVMVIPIIQNDEPWGLICAFDVEKERVFDESEEVLLQSTKQMIASAMTRMEITRDLMLHTDRLRQEVEDRRDFFARMSHEIRTPMNAILGMTELALRERMSNSAYEHIMTVKQTGMNLLSIINDILDFSKIDSGNMELLYASYNISSLIHDIVSIIRMKLAYTRIRFLVEIDSRIPSEVIGDEGKIRQILINLLSNAVKYTQKGFIKLTVKGTVIKGVLNLWMIVTDSGKGIREEDQKKLFRDYIQVDQQKNAGIEGVGLGLSITNGLVRAMNGTISLQSVYGEGSEFSVMIPQKVHNFERIAQVNNPKSKPTLIYERRKLYVDTLTGALTNLDVKCDVADNSEDVLRIIASGSYAYLIGSVDLLTEIKYKLQDLTDSGCDFQVIGIAEYGDESDSIWRTLSTPIHTVSLANIFNGNENRYVYADDGDDSSIKFSAPEAKVLIVDDISTNLKVAAGLLSIFDVDIDVCSSGADAIEYVREKRYDIIFMDHRMPGMDGIETTQHIREMGNGSGRDGKDADSEDDNENYFKKVPIVALTANVVPNMRETFLETGFNDFIGKPIDTVVLAGVMRRWIPKSKQRRFIETATAVDETASSKETGITLTIPGVDVERGFRTAGGKMDLYLDIISTFHEEANEKVAQLYEYLEAGNIRLYTTTVHAIKGALANIGAIELSELGAKIELAGDRKDINFIEKNNEHFVSGIGRLLTNIKAVLTETAKNAGEGKETGKEDTENFITSLLELKEAIEDMDAGTMNKTLENLLSDALTEQSLSTVRTISRHILMAEYDDAEQLIDGLIKALSVE